MTRICSTIVLVFLTAAAMAQTTQPVVKEDLFRKNTTWKGRERNPTGKNKSWPAHVKVVARKFEKVTFNFWTVSDDGQKGVQLEGTVDDAGQIKARVTKVLPGDDWHETMVGQFFSGSVKDKTLTLNRKSQHGASLTSELMLQGKDKE